jgi:hypothetical protein
VQKAAKRQAAAFELAVRKRVDKQQDHACAGVSADNTR